MIILLEANVHESDSGVVNDTTHNMYLFVSLEFHYRDRIDIHIEYSCIEYGCDDDMYSIGMLMYTKHRSHNIYDNLGFHKNDTLTCENIQDSSYPVNELTSRSKLKTTTKLINQAIVDEIE